MVLFETHQRFKGRFLNELGISFKNLQYSSENICVAVSFQ